MNHKNKKLKGVALLVAILVTLTLSVFLVNNFEQNRTNLSLLATEETQFKLTTINISILKAITLTIKEKGANYAYDFTSILSSIPDFPIALTQNLPDILLYNPKISSLDHYDYLNGRYNNRDRIATFNGILNQKLKQATLLEGDYKEIALNDNQFISLIENWRTKRGNSNINQSIPIEYKEANLDLLSEFYFLINQGLKRDKIIPNQEFYRELPFRIFSTNGDKHTSFNTERKKSFGNLNPICSIGRFNLNMLPKTSKSAAESEIEDFLEWFSFQSNNNCKNIKNSKEQILERINNQFFQDEETVILLPSAIGQNHFTANLNTFNLSNVEAKKYFTFRSDLVGISYEVGSKSLRIKVNAQLYLEYKDNSDKPDKIYILYYKIS